MLRIPAKDDAFLFSQAPTVKIGDLRAAVLSSLGEGPLPDLLYWDAKVPGEKNALIEFGRGGLDPYLAAGYDLTNCVAVREGALLGAAGEPQPQNLSRAIGVLARSPAVRSRWCGDLNGIIGAQRDGTTIARRASSDVISIALLVSDAVVPIEPFFAALAQQTIDVRIEVVVAACNMDSQTIKALAAVLEQCATKDTRLKVRRYNLAGHVAPTYLTNVAVALASGDVVVVADPRCTPQSPRLIQTLAAWAAAADVSTVCPRVEHDEGLYAGLALDLSSASGGHCLRPYDCRSLSDDLRLTAAPAPWFFATRRKAWLASGGLLDTPDLLWTAGLAGAAGPRGKHLMAGSEYARWNGQTPVPAGASAVAPERVRSSSLMAVGAGKDRSGPSVDKYPDTATIAVEFRRAPSVAFALNDQFGSTVAARLLIIADAFGPSQAIPFQHGLAEFRSRGQIAVRLVEEAAFAKDFAEVRDQVRDLFTETRPTVVVVSRLGSRPIWRAVREEARRNGTRLVFHIDDDLLDPPVTLGLERYRVARHPDRLHTLHHCLSDCDATLAASPALARRLENLAGHRRIDSMAIGSGGTSPRWRSSPARDGRLLIGYMGSASHNHDLAMIAPALNRIMETCDQVDVALFGSIARQPAAKLLNHRVSVHPGVFGDYAGFRRRLSELRFDIGVAPLRDTAFNRVKTPTKWVEYAEAGIPCLASNVEPYAEIFRAGAAIPAGPDQWETALRHLVENETLREELVARADRLLTTDFGWQRLGQSVMTALGCQNVEGLV